MPLLVRHLVTVIGSDLVDAAEDDEQPVLDQAVKDVISPTEPGVPAVRITPAWEDRSR